MNNNLTFDLYFFQLKADIEAKVVKQLSELTAHSYKTQVVAGINYFIKVIIIYNIILCIYIVNGLFVIKPKVRFAKAP